MLRDVFGFSGDDRFLQLGDQRIRLAQGAAVGHGMIDHLALAVPDLDQAAAAMLARGAQLDPRVTPDGPKGIAEFWTAGVRYLFLQGPEGARIELIQNLGSPHALGHDHIGIPCSDIGASQAFWELLGAKLTASVVLSRPEGATQVRFLTLGSSTVELYQPPTVSPPAPSGLWRRLLIAGAVAATGPDGLLVAPL